MAIKPMQYTVTVVKTVYTTTQITVTAQTRDDAHDLALSEARQTPTKRLWHECGREFEVRQVLNENGVDV